MKPVAITSTTRPLDLELIAEKATRGLACTDSHWDDDPPRAVAGLGAAIVRVKIT